MAPPVSRFRFPKNFSLFVLSVLLAISFSSLLLLRPRINGAVLKITKGSGKPYVVAIMALWDEALTLPLALDSSRHFVSEYIVVHKRGTDNTSNILQECIFKWGLRVQYFESNMTLREARMFSIKLTEKYADLYLLQDGDEVMYHRGPTALSESIPLIFSAGYDVISSKMVYLKHNLLSTLKDSYIPGGAGKWGGFPANNIILIPHPTIFRNLPGRIIMPGPLTEDVPQIAGGRSLVTHDPWKFDVSIKNPVREYLRGFFLDWSAAGSPDTIEKWAVDHDQSHREATRKFPGWTIEDTARNHASGVEKFIIPYNEEEWHKYPDSIKVYINAGRIRGYEGGEILSVEV